MKLITTVIYTFEQTLSKESIKEHLEDGMTLEEIYRDREKFMHQEVIGDIEGCLDNNGYIDNWSIDRITMNWEE